MNMARIQKFPDQTSTAVGREGKYKENFVSYI